MIIEKQKVIMTIADIHSKFRFRTPLHIRWSDMDELQHVNNAVYLTYFEQGRVWYFHESCNWNWKTTGCIIATTHVNYLRPLYFTDEAYIYIRTSNMGTKSFDVEYAIIKVEKGIEKLASTGYCTLVMYDYKTSTSIPIPDYIRNGLMDYEKVKF